MVSAHELHVLNRRLIDATTEPCQLRKGKSSASHVVTWALFLLRLVTSLRHCARVNFAKYCIPVDEIIIRFRSSHPAFGLGIWLASPIVKSQYIIVLGLGSVLGSLIHTPDGASVGVLIQNLLSTTIVLYIYTFFLGRGPGDDRGSYEDDDDGAATRALISNVPNDWLKILRRHQGCSD